MTNQQIESGYRSIPAPRLHDIDEAKHRVAVDFPITIDAYKTDFGPSAFDRGWRERLPVMSINHHPEARIGEAIGAESLHDRHRLIGEFDSTERGLRGFREVRDGKYPGWSFEYAEGKAIPHPTVPGAHRLTSARMKEYGPVSRPAIPGTRVVGLRSRDFLDVDELAEQLRARFGIRPGITTSTAGLSAFAEARIGSIGDRLEDLRTRGIVPKRNPTVESARRSINDLNKRINHERN